MLLLENLKKNEDRIVTDFYFPVSEAKFSDLPETGIEIGKIRPLRPDFHRLAKAAQHHIAAAFLYSKWEASMIPKRSKAL